MDAKKLLISALIVMMFSGLANAAVDITVNDPATGRLIRPNFDGIKYIDFNVTYIDDDELNAIHELGIRYTVADTNVYMTSDSNSEKPGSDINLSTDNCSFVTANVWTTPGADCIIRYTLPTSPQIPTGTYVIDFNGTSYSAAAGMFEANDLAAITLSFDNRFIDSAVEALLNLLPVILIAGVVIGIILVGFGAISPKTLLMITVAAVVTIIIVVVLSGIMGILTP